MSRHPKPTPLSSALESLEDRSVPAIITVTTLLDDFNPNNGILSLREAIAAADADSAQYPPNMVIDDDVIANTTGAFGAIDERIEFAAGLTGTIALDSFLGPLQITQSNLTIQGPGSSLLAISGQNAIGVIEISAVAGTVEFRDLTLTEGNAGSGDGGALLILSDTAVGLVQVVVENSAAGNGGGIFVSAGQLFTSIVTIRNNAATQHGGGIAVSDLAPSGTLVRSLAGTTIEGNTATTGIGGGVYLAAAELDGSGFEFIGNVAVQGGAIHTPGGKINITDSAFDKNQAAGGGIPNDGGAIYSFGGSGSISNSTFSSNAAGALGGAILHSPDSLLATFTISNSTFAGNIAGSLGGALAVDASAVPGPGFAAVALVNVTITQNSANQGGGIALNPTADGGPPASLLNTIVAANTAPNISEILGPIISLGNNLIGDATGANGFVASDLVNVANPGLAPLAFNGVPSQGIVATQTVALLPGSPALGKANPTGAPSIDQRHFPRPAGGPTDIGAFQAQVPTGNPDNFSAPFDQPLVVPAPGVLSNDLSNDPAYPVLTAAIVSVPPATEGTVTLNPDGSFTFTPATGFSGMTSFTYAVSNGTGLGAVRSSLPTTVTITVDAPVAPIANPDSFSTGSNQPVTVPAPGVLSNDVVNNPNRTLSAVLDTSPPATAGTLALNADGSFTFTPAPTFFGAATFTYLATDGAATSAPTTVTITVDAPQPPPVLTHLFAVGAGAGGGPVVRVFNEDETPRFAFFAFDPAFDGGVRVAVGDVTGDSFDDIVVATGPGGGPHVKVYDGVTGVEVASFFAYAPDFSLGVHLAVGDVNNDGFADIITGAGSGGGPNVKVFSGLDRSELLSFFAYDPGFRGGARVGAGDLDGFPGAEIVTIAGPSGGPDVRVWDRFADTLDQFFAFDPAYRAGGFVSVLDGRILVGPDSFPDFDGSLLANQFTAFPGSRGAVGTALPSAALLTRQPQVLMFDFPVLGEDDAAGPAQTLPVLDPGFLGGVRIAAGRYSGQDGVFVTAGPGGLSRIQFFPYDGSLLSPVPTLDDVALPDPGFLGSVYVGGGVGSPAASSPTAPTSSF